MKTKLAMCNLGIDEESMEITIEDVQKIDHVPENIQKFIYQYCYGRKMRESYLPEVLYLGNNLKVVGAFVYGEIGFIEFEGTWEDMKAEETLLCIDAYKKDESNEEIDVVEAEE